MTETDNSRGGREEGGGGRRTACAVFDQRQPSVVICAGWRGGERAERR